MLVLIAVSTALRSLFIAATDLTDTEAYYVSWSWFPSWSYYDHPPGIAWLVTGVQALSAANWAPRIVPLACAALLSWMLFLLGSRLFSPRAGFVAALIITALPAFFFIGFFVNPEAPLGPLWVGYLLMLDGLRTRREWWRPTLMGAVMGVAFLCKYTAILLVPITLVFLLATPAARGWLRRPSFYLGGVVALGLALPVIGWNVAHGWPTLMLHFGERMPPLLVSDVFRHAGQFVLGQGLAFHPLLMPGLLAVGGWCLKRARHDDRTRLLVVASGIAGLVLACLMLRVSDAESHWTMVVYLPLAVGAGGWFDQQGERLSAGLKRYLGASLAITVAFVGVCLVNVETSALATEVPGYEAALDPTNEAWGWEELRPVLRDRAVKPGANVAVVAAHSVLCGHLLVALRDVPRVYCASPRRSEFDFVGRHLPPDDEAFLYVDRLRGILEPDLLFPNRECRVLERVPIRRGTLPIDSFQISRCGPTRRDDSPRATVALVGEQAPGLRTVSDLAGHAIAGRQP